MAKSSFLLVNLKEDQTKHLAQVITNDSCRKILDFLADNPATESELSTKLSIPISTVHYNLHALVKAGLVEADEFHYSSKGREVLHYKLANKYIIIAPKSTYGIKEKLKSILPVAGVMAGVAIAISFIRSQTIMMASSTQSAVKQQVLDDLRSGSQPVLDKASEAVQSAPSVINSATASAGNALSNMTTTTLQAVHTTTTTLTSNLHVYHEPNIALWFFVGGLVAIAVYLMIDYIVYKTSSK